MKARKRKVRIDRCLIIGSIAVGTFCGLHKMFEPREIKYKSYEVKHVEMAEMLSDCLVEQEEQAYESLGTFRITYYCPGSCCNGQNAGLDCKGNPLIPGTIATNDLPYGTVVYINLDGVMVEYTVRDRMAKKERSMPSIDIFMDLPHDVVQDLGVDYVEVFVKK